MEYSYLVKIPTMSKCFSITQTLIVNPIVILMKAKISLLIFLSSKISKIVKQDA